MELARTIAAFACLLAAGPLSAEGRLDTAFGQQGFVVEGFQAAPAGGPIADADIGIAACAGPQGRLVATGVASGLTRVVTMFLTKDGELDQGVGFGGKQSFALPEGRKDDVRGMCQSDGKPVLAYNLARNDDADRPHHEIRLVRIDAATGLPDASFGTGGTVRIDLDTQFGLTIAQRPLALVAGPGGDLLVMGSYQRVGHPETAKVEEILLEHGFVLRVTSAGVLEAAVSADEIGSTARRYLGGGMGSSRLRVAGGDGETIRTPGRLVESEFFYPSLDHFGDSIDAAAPEAVPFGARTIDGGRLAVAVAIDGAPAVMVSESDGPQRIRRLPEPLIDGGPAAIYNAQLSASGDGVIYVASIARGASPEAWYAARLEGTPDGSRPDPRFGQGGSVVVRPPVVAGCNAPGTFAFARFTLWNGAITAIGALDRACVAGDADLDYAVVRLQSRLFGDAFEPRYPVR